jgi:hypothetical protein
VNAVHVAPAPFIARDPKLDNGVAGFMEVLGGVFTGRVVTAADMSACQAQAQVHPPAAGPEAFFTPCGVGCHISDLIHMLAFVHG